MAVVLDLYPDCVLPFLNCALTFSLFLLYKIATIMVLQSANCGSTRAKSILSDGKAPVQHLLTSWPPVILAMSNECLASLSLLNI